MFQKKAWGLFVSLLILHFVTLGQFAVVGEATRIERNCFELTPDSLSGYGKVITGRTFNLEKPLTLYTEMYFGNKDQGGNGIAFFFQSDKEVNTDQDTLYGLGDNQPSIAVEFDTYQHAGPSGVQSDPEFDHIALMQDGDFFHGGSNNLEGPVIANPTGNITDDAWHAVKIDWAPNSNTITVTFDCEEKINYQIDLINEVFDGNPNVFYGFSAGSFTAFNQQQVCVEINSISNLLQDVTICNGGKTQINAIVGAASYQWTPSEGLNTDVRSNPIASPSERTTYLLEVETGYCDEVLDYVVNINVDTTTSNVELGTDTTLCSSETYILNASTPNATAYAWSNGKRDSAIVVNRTGRYDVTVTINDVCIVEDWVRITFLEEPQVFFGNDTTICQRSNGFVLKPFVDLEVTYLWNDGSTADSLIVNRPGFYNVTVENQCGMDEAGILVNSESCRDFYMPNAFSPNGDGFNDVIFPFSEKGDIIQVTRYSIYNRWGSQVHLIENGEPNNRDIGWDGKINGKPAAPGIYVFEFILQFRDGQESLIKGNFKLF